MKVLGLPVFAAVAAGLSSSCCAFVVPRTQFLRFSRASVTVAVASKASLDSETTWRLRFVLNGVPTAGGRRVDELFVVEAQFLEDEGYEPPQGSVRQVLSPSPADGGDDHNTGARRQLEIAGGSWKLSEDPSERKDGLWVWGLFKEPLYPFMLLQLETKEITLPGDEGDSIKPLKLYAQISHTRDDEAGVVLKASTLNVREMETIKADPFGGATVDIYEEVNIGQISIQPLTTPVQA